MNDVAALLATNSVPQTVNLGAEGDVAARVLRVNGVEPKTSGAAAALTMPQIAAGGKAFTAQVECLRMEGVKEPLPHQRTMTDRDRRQAGVYRT